MSHNIRHWLLLLLSAVAIALLLFPYETGKCGSGADALTGKPIDQCEIRIEPLLWRWVKGEGTVTGKLW